MTNRHPLTEESPTTNRSSPAPAGGNAIDSRLASIVSRTSDPKGFARWESLAAQAGYCRRPVRLAGRIEEVEAGDALVAGTCAAEKALARRMARTARREFVKSWAA